MLNERMKILQMIAEGTITPEDGEKLLSRLDPAESTTARVESERGTGDGETRPFKYLRVVVDGKDKANVRVPIGLIRTGIKLTALMPLSASERLSEQGIDLSQFTDFDSDEVMESLQELKVEVDSENGDSVRVFWE